MGFRLIPKSATLNDPERRNGRYLAYSTEFRSLEANYVNAVEDRPIKSATKIYYKESS